MPLDHECPKARACPLCNPTQEMMWWVARLTPSLLSKTAELGDMEFEKARELIHEMITEKCNDVGLSGLLAQDVANIISYRLN